MAAAAVVVNSDSGTVELLQPISTSAENDRGFVLRTSRTAGVGRKIRHDARGFRWIDAHKPKAYDASMKAFLETLGDLGKPNKHFSPKWKSDYRHA